MNGLKGKQERRAKVSSAEGEGRRCSPIGRSESQQRRVSASGVEKQVKPPS